ncbi:MAG: helix-turn-helix domain-containing protein [Lactococcus lactis]
MGSNHVIQNSVYYEQFKLGLDETLISKNTFYLLNSLSASFAHSIKYLNDHSGLSRKKIAEKCSMSDRQLSKWETDFSNEIQVFPLNLLKFCVALSLPPEICDFLFELKGTKLPRNENGLIYTAIKNRYYSASLFEINDILESAHLETWE